MRLKTSFCNDAHFYFRRTSKKSWFSFYFRYSNILLRNVLFLKGKAFTKFHLKTYLIIMGIKWTVFISKQMYRRFSGVIWKTWQKLNKKSIYVFKWPSTNHPSHRDAMPLDWHEEWPVECPLIHYHCTCVFSHAERSVSQGYMEFDFPLIFQKGVSVLASDS